MTYRSAWAPPTTEPGVEWIERTHRLSTGARPGPLRLDPHQRDVVRDLTAVGPPFEVYLMASAQGSGKSTAARSALCYWLGAWGAPVVYVLPDEVACKEVMRQDVVPLFADNAVLAELLPASPRAVQAQFARLSNGGRVRMAWAGSAPRIAMHPERAAICDEVDKYPDQSSDGSDPIALARARLKTYEPRHKLMALCTPTTPAGRIATLYETCPDRRVWAVPCPGCSSLTTLAWDRVGWRPAERDEGGPQSHPVDPEARIALASALSAEPGAVWVACATCGYRLRDADLRRARHGGRWVPAPGARPDARGAGAKRAYQVGDLATMPLARTAAAYLSAITPSQRQEFWNQTLGLPFADSSGEVPEWRVRQLATQRPGDVPSWATAIVAAADTQVDHWWYVVRAVGANGRRRGLAWGRSETWAELCEATLGRTWPRGLRTTALGVDVRGGVFGGQAGGQRTSEVYALVRKTRGAVAILGEDRRDVASPEPWTWAVKHQTKTLRVHVHLFKDRVSAAVVQDDPPVWEEPTTASDPQYLRQFCSQIKVTTTKPNGHQVEEWRPRSTARHDHLFDASVYCEALTDAIGAERARPLGGGVEGVELESNAGESSSGDDFPSMTKRGRRWADATRGRW